MHKWEFEIRGGNYFCDLTYQMRSNDVSFAYEDDDTTGLLFLGYSAHLDPLTDFDSAIRRLYSIELLVNGALRLGLNTPLPQPLRFHRLIDLEKKCSANVTLVASIEESPFADSIEEVFTSEQMRSHWPSRILHASKTDLTARSLAFLSGMISTSSSLECIATWSTLYKMRDTIRTGCDELSVEPEKLCDIKQVEAFTAACNNENVLGLAARHGKTSSGKPKKTISDLNEAITLMVALGGEVSKRLCDRS
jgi:hypothetical protein